MTTSTLLVIAMWVLIAVAVVLLGAAAWQGVNTPEGTRWKPRLHFRRSGAHSRKRGLDWESSTEDADRPTDFLPAATLTDEPLHDDTLWDAPPAHMPPPVPQPASDPAQIWHEPERVPEVPATARLLRLHFGRAMYEAALLAAPVHVHGRPLQLRAQLAVVSLLAYEAGGQLRAARMYPDLAVTGYPEWSTGEFAAVDAGIGAS